MKIIACLMVIMWAITHLWMLIPRHWNGGRDE